MGEKKQQRKSLMLHSMNKLKKKCKAERVSFEGNKTDMIDRIISKKYDTPKPTEQQQSNTSTESIENTENIQNVENMETKIVFDGNYWNTFIERQNGMEPKNE